ncbi:MAG TPA: zinc-dependent metalloprotease, partial [Lacipirellulaceae bacterium]|nr:zinc-dependent metalloprotease [Lacipirellulaceae bacterium]
ADIIFDADFLQYWKNEYETFTPNSVAMLTGGPIEIEDYRAQQKKMPAFMQDMHGGRAACSMLGGLSRQFALGASVMAGRKRSEADQEKMIMQGLKEVTMHEVGHTFGLAHNFHGSTMYSLKDLNDVEKTKNTGLGASVMDYNPVNLMPKDETQGDYYSTTIGPYDMWAIEYGYKPIKGGSPDAEVAELKKIASRSGEPGLAYSADEDTRGIDPDPHSMRFDLSNDLIEYAKSQSKLVAESLPHVVDDATKDGDGYQRARRAFGILIARQGEVMFDASRYIGGLYVSRSHKGDAKAAKPLEIVPAERQRAALELLEQQVFNDKPFNFTPEMYNQLAASHWDHWGTQTVERSDYPAQEVILMWQDRILSKLLSSLTLARLHDSEFKTPTGTDALTTAELIEGLTKSVYSEVDSTKEGEYTNRKPAISSLRRNLQRSYLRRVSQLAMGETFAPQDCQTVAYAELGKLKTRIDSLVNGQVKLDSYSKDHLQETSTRIAKVLDARMLTSP